MEEKHTQSLRKVLGSDFMKERGEILRPGYVGIATVTDGNGGSMVGVLLVTI